MEQAIQVFTSQKIPVLVPGQAEYRQAIATSNLLFRFSRPECVVQPRDAAQVQTIIREAKARSIKVTIKGNGHSYAGHSTAFSGISLDLRGMKNVKLDMDNMTVTMDAGCQWGDVYEKLIIGHHDRYIITRSFGMEPTPSPKLHWSPPTAPLSPSRNPTRPTRTRAVSSGPSAALGVATLVWSFR
jgi:hypothetical protein